MFSFLPRTLAVGALTAAASLTTPQQADAYPVDCAILLCLAGGWPASAECAHARAVFIARITPFPIQPPLQIWRCPMHSSISHDGPASPVARFYDIAFRGEPTMSWIGDESPQPAVMNSEMAREIANSFVQQVQADVYDPDNGVASIDISSAQFDFVRSIRVFHVQARQYMGRDDCFRWDTTRLGTYGLQGDFAWRSSSVTALPASFGAVPPNDWRCEPFSYRAVMIDWRDHMGNYGFERVDY
jgi:hypothetical protein